MTVSLSPKFRATVLDQKNVTEKSGMSYQVNGARKTYQYEWERTSNPLWSEAIAYSLNLGTKP